MKYILLCMCLLSLLGCGTDTNTQQDTKPTTTANEQVKTEQDTHVMAAKQALSSGDYAKAVEEANAAIKADANNGEAYSIRGFATALNGDTTKGLADTKKAYDLDPNNVANYYNMAMVYKLQGQFHMWNWSLRLVLHRIQQFHQQGLLWQIC